MSGYLSNTNERDLAAGAWAVLRAPAGNNDEVIIMSALGQGPIRVSATHWCATASIENVPDAVEPEQKSGCSGDIKLGNSDRALPPLPSPLISDHAQASYVEGHDVGAAKKVIDRAQNNRSSSAARDGIIAAVVVGGLVGCSIVLGMAGYLLNIYASQQSDATGSPFNSSNSSFFQ